ncbi:MAG: signal peptidase II [Bacillota bacterium]
MRLFLIATAVVGLDQISKYIVDALMETGQSIPVIHNFLYITYLRNPGAAFGMLPYRTVFFIIVTLLVMGFIIYFYRTLPAGFSLLRIGLALQLGGAVGNLVDRIRSTYVTDFISFTIFPPVFNLADTAIVIGIIIFLFSFWRMSPVLDGKS